MCDAEDPFFRFYQFPARGSFLSIWRESADQNDVHGHVARERPANAATVGACFDVRPGIIEVRPAMRSTGTQSSAGGRVI